MIVRNQALVMLAPVVTAAAIIDSVETSIGLEVEQTGLSDTDMDHFQRMRVCLKDVLATLDEYAVLYDDVAGVMYPL